jgi:hypothetical protein
MFTWNVKAVATVLGRCVPCGTSATITDGRDLFPVDDHCRFLNDLQDLLGMLHFVHALDYAHVCEKRRGESTARALMR